MRTITILFICAELLDLLTTFIGVGIGLTEVNPIVGHLGWYIVILIKIIGTIVISIFLERKTPRKYDIIFPIIAGIPVLWNIFQLILSFSYLLYP